jgi:5-methylcytosine-specific restriction enzyme subunit McrC
MSKVLRFFEYDKLKFSKVYLTDKCCEYLLTDEQVSAIKKYHTLSDGLYYDLIDNGIRFKEHVGVIQINDLIIEVLPKIDRNDSDAGQWHDILLDMLKECRFMNPQSSGYANLKLKANSVLHLYFEKFVSELEILLRQGLIKKYRVEESNQTSLKGRLVFSQHIQQNLIHAERFYTQHTVYDIQHSLHQILRQALDVIATFSKTSILRERINILLNELPESQKLVVSQKTFEQFTITRKTAPYQEALQIARMILLNYHPDLRGGKQSVLALMFNMNELWEEFIFRRLKAAGRLLNWKVSDQKEWRYWSGESGHKKLIPDIVIFCSDTGQKIIIDTKWKKPNNLKPDDHDLRQLLSYKLYFQGDHAFLLYPSQVESYVINGDYRNQPHQSTETVFKEPFGLHGGMAFFKILNGNNLINKSDFHNLVDRLLRPA